ncbi:DNA cytosine methyltransferase [Enterovirga sp. CN4-39]|uniref:DNA cytosine methyltransferase n=1 Tax=Enterovirga sp. CN4-39 TaxID=3400910 RepID=UPI003C05769B
MSKLRVLDLFSGIGGFSLGLERTGGFETVAFCEIEPFPRRVLAKHWPNVPIYEDVRELSAERLAADGIVVDVICGGFPCQDISVAGKGAGLDGERSGLWSEIARLAGELRPRFVIVENVAALLGRGLDRVLGDLAALGFDAEWHCIPASALGAPHRRDRFWLVAYAAGEVGARLPSGTAAQVTLSRGTRGNVAYAGGLRRRQVEQQVRGRAEGWGAADQALQRSYARGREWWSSEPDVGRVAHGVPARVDRLRALGNAVVPQIPELIGRAILASLASPTHQERAA